MAGGAEAYRCRRRTEELAAFNRARQEIVRQEIVKLLFRTRSKAHSALKNLLTALVCSAMARLEVAAGDGALRTSGRRKVDQNVDAEIGRVNFKKVNDQAPSNILDFG